MIKYHQNLRNIVLIWRFLNGATHFIFVTLQFQLPPIYMYFKSIKFGFINEYIEGQAISAENLTDKLKGNLKSH